MIAVVQRVLRGCVRVDGEAVGEIGAGMLVLAAVEDRDTEKDVEWMAGKLAGLRIFRDVAGEKHFDRDITHVGGAMLLVSNFTVAAETAKSRRPSLDRAASPEKARVLFEKLIVAARARGIPVQTGRFGADMKVELENDGPATFIVQSPVQAGVPAQAPLAAAPTQPPAT